MQKIILKLGMKIIEVLMTKQNLKELKKQMLLNILSAEKSIFIYYKNKQLTKDKKNVKQIRSMATNS